MSNKIQFLAAQKREAIKKSEESKDETVQAIYQQVSSQFDAKIEKLKAAQRVRAAKLRGAE